MIEQVSAALTKAGFPHDPQSLEISSRGERIAVRISHNRMAWFPANEAGRASLLKERRILRLLEKHCRFPVPRVLFEDETGWELRALVEGAVRPPGLFERIVADSVFAHAFGEELGMMLADQHTRVPYGELTGWLPTVPSWPRPQDLPHLAQVIDDSTLLARIGQALRWREELRRVLSDPVLVHGDVGLHNLAVDPVSYRALGLFDYEGAVLGDRHQDFAYMVFPPGRESMLEGALATYESATRIKIDRDRVRLMNAIAAIGFLAFRRGHAPEDPWCGRTLAQDLAWTHAALEGIGL